MLISGHAPCPRCLSSATRGKCAHHIASGKNIQEGIRFVSSGTLPPAWTLRGDLQIFIIRVSLSVELVYLSQENQTKKGGKKEAGAVFGSARLLLRIRGLRASGFPYVFTFVLLNGVVLCFGSSQRSPLCISASRQTSATLSLTRYSFGGNKDTSFCTSALSVPSPCWRCVDSKVFLDLNQ